MKAQLTPETKLSSLDKLELRRKLDHFYENIEDYLAFSAVSHQVECWMHIEKVIRQKLEIHPERTPAVLEIGAGKSGFSKWLQEQGIRELVCYSVQDVTSQNATWLKSQADHVIYGDVSTISPESSFDIIFSTYVLEHVTNPALHLEQLHKLLSDDGNMFIFCPRYDVPGYLNPSSRHLSLPTRLAFEIRRCWARFNSLISRRPAFLIQTDLAAFHRPFFLDADAVHWVSLLDIKIWARIKGSLVKPLKLGKPRPWSKDWIVKRWLTCAIEISKKGK